MNNNNNLMKRIFLNKNRLKIIIPIIFHINKFAAKKIYNNNKNKLKTNAINFYNAKLN